MIEIKHIFKSYDRISAVDDLSFTVSEASCFGFLGPNGAGKTTMMKMIYGKNRRDPHPETCVQIFGYDPAQQSLEIKYLAGVVPQENNLDDEINVWQNLQVYSRFYGLQRAEANRRIDELLAFFELTEKKRAKIRALSGGMKRRLVIARALLHSPRLLILDEPTTGLDPQVRHLIWDKLRQLKKEGLTILLTTHYMEEAFQLCDQILIMDHGKKVIEGPPRTLLSEHIEPFVLEIHEDHAVDLLNQWTVPEQLRREHHASRPLLYGDNLEDLKQFADQLGQHDYYLRQANLEDLFLKLTGRRLNAGQ